VVLSHARLSRYRTFVPYVREAVFCYTMRSRVFFTILFGPGPLSTSATLVFLHLSRPGPRQAIAGIVQPLLFVSRMKTRPDFKIETRR
jgi:hypothetical protein